MTYKGWSGGKSIDWDAVDTEAPKPLAVGVYKAKITKAEPRETSKGDPGASLQFKVFEAYDSDEELNRKCFDNLTFTQDGAFRAKMICEALDIDPPATSSFEDVSGFCEELEGCEIWVHLIHNTYQGRTSNRIIQYIAESDLKEYIAGLDDGDSAEDDRPARKSRSKNGRSAKADSDDLNEDKKAKTKDDDEERPRRRRQADADDEERPRRRRQADAN